MESPKKSLAARLLARLGGALTEPVQRTLAHHRRDNDRLRMLLGGLHADRVRALPADAPIHDAEFSVYSQWGQDGILEHVFNHVPVENDTFVEFGVHHYRESNTRFLLQHRNWRGLVLDGDPANIESIVADKLSWQYELQARHGFVTAENINGLIRDAGFSGDIGLLSIDIDGMDYWVWKAIDVVEPRVVVTEYNSLFGAGDAVTVPYDPKFRRRAAHYSHLYFGASVAAFDQLARSRGYRFIGCTSAGNDAFFVREDCLGGLRPVSAREGFVASRTRESRGRNGELTRLDRDAGRELIADMELVDVRTGGRVRVRDLDAT